MTYTIIMEQAADRTWSALVPDLPGLLLAGDTRADLIASAPGAILDYFDVMLDDGQAIPEATTEAVQVTVTLPAA